MFPFDVLQGMLRGQTAALQSGVSALRGYELAVQQQRAAQNAYAQMSNDFDRISGMYNIGMGNWTGRSWTSSRP